MEKHQKNYYPHSNILESEGELLNNEKQGEWKYYHPNGVMKQYGNYQNDLAEGEFYYFNEAGKKTSQGGFKNDKWEGVWSWYNENEQEYCRGYYSNALKAGNWFWFLPDGKIKREAHYANDALHGKDTSYFENGKTASIQNWKNGLLDGAYEKWNTNGDLIEKGTYQEGFKHGKFIIFENSKEKEIEYEMGCPILTEKQISQILKVFATKKDFYKIEDAIEKVVGWESIYASIWQMIRLGHTIPIHLLGFGGLSKYTNLITPEYLIKLLKTADFSEKSNIGGKMFKFWSYDLDKMCMHLYFRSPEAFENVWEEFTPLAQEGFKTVLVRFGKLPANKLSKKMASYIAHNLLHTQANGYKVYSAEGIADYVWWYENGTLIELDTYKPDNFQKFVEKFVPFKDFKKSLLKESLKFQWNLPLPQAYPAVEEAGVEEFIQLYKAFSASDYHNFYQALLEMRNDSIEELETIIQGVKEDYRAGQKAETAVIAAILKRKKQNQPVPEWYDDLIGGDSFYQGMESNSKKWFVGLEQTQEALLYLPKERVTNIFKRILNEKYLWKSAFPIIHLMDKSLQVDAIQILSDKLEKDLTIYNIQPIAKGLSHIENIEWLDSVTFNVTPQKNIYEVLTMAMLIKLADMADKQIFWDEKYDQHIDIHLWLPKYGDDFDHYLQPYFEKITNFLPPERLVKQLLPQIQENKITTIRIFSLLSDNSPNQILERAFEAVGTNQIKILNTNWIQRSLSEKLKINAERLIRLAIEKGADGEMLNTFKNAIGEEKLKKIYAQLKGNNMEKLNLTPANLLKQLCQKYFDKNPNAQGQTVYYLAPDYDKTVSANEINRIRGNALTIKEDLIPKFNLEPMKHIFTLDLDKLPLFKKQVGEEYKAFAFFSYEEEWENPSKTVLLKAEDILEIPASEDGYSFEVTEIKIPSGAFFMDYDAEQDENYADLKTIRKKIFNAPAYVCGEPIWIQEPEDGPDFYMQFSESFGDMNLGDSGEMYVFKGYSFWQCY